MLTPILLCNPNAGWYSITDAPGLDLYSVGASVGVIKIFKRTGGIGDFVDTGEPDRTYWGCGATPGGNIYVTTSGGDIYMQTGGTGPFVALGQASRLWRGICPDNAGNVLACVSGGDIYKQTGGVGAFVGIGETSRNWEDICVHPVTGDVYAVDWDGDIYKQTGGSGPFVGLGQTHRPWTGIAACPVTGDVYACDSSTTGMDHVYRQKNGVGDFILVSAGSAKFWRGVAVDSLGAVYANNRWNSGKTSYDYTYTLKAVITYNDNGAPGSTQPPSQNYNPGEEATIAGQGSMTWYGHNFLNWNTEADGSGTTYNPSDTFYIYDNITLYAQWEVIPMEFHVEAVGSNTFPFDTRAKAATNFHELINGLYINEGVDELYEGWTVFAYGEITEPVDEWDWFEGNGVDIIGEGSQDTIIDLDTSSFEDVSMYDCSVFTDNPNAEWNSAIYDARTVENCKFDGNDLWYQAVEAYRTDRSVRIIGCSFENLMYYPIYIDQDFLTAENEIIIVNNSFDNPTDVVELYIELYDCTIGKVHIYNNVAKRTTFFIDLDNITINEFLHDHNISLEGYDYTEDGSPIALDPTETTVDPLFLYTDPNNQLAIDSSSPAYHTGILRDDVPTVDLMGINFGSPPSRGAYEVGLLVNFEGIPEEGFSPLTVQFVDRTEGIVVTTWLWEFGDGNTSTLPNPVHTYLYPGVYTVKLTINGTESETKEAYIAVYEELEGDILFNFDEEKGFGDIFIECADLKRDPGFETAVFISLFTDKRAEDSDALPNNQTDKRGWWGDNTLGSKLWLIEREKLLNEAKTKAEQYSKEALQWLIDEGIAETILTEAVLRRGEAALILNIQIIQKSGEPIYFKYYYNWEAQIARRA